MRKTVGDNQNKKSHGKSINCLEGVESETITLYEFFTEPANWSDRGFIAQNQLKIDGRTLMVRAQVCSDKLSCHESNLNL